MQSQTHTIPQLLYPLQAVFIHNKLKQHKHRQLNKTQQQPLRRNNNNNTMNIYKGKDKWKQNNVCNRKLNVYKSSVKSFLAYKIITQRLEIQL